MSGGHIQALYRHGHGPLDDVAPQVKLAATLLFVLAVVATPREAFWAFGVHAAMLVAIAIWARVPLGFIGKRLIIEIPFLLFAVFLPFVGRGEHVEVIGLSLSVSGLWAAWNVIAKATLGATASILLAATTQVPDLLKGFSRLRFPRVFVAIMSFMVRYLDVVIGELGRMRVALQSRAYKPRRIGHARALASTAGVLFVRSYERGERVHLAMLSRGFTGTVPEMASAAVPSAHWAIGAGVAALAAAVAALGWVLR